MSVNVSGRATLAAPVLPVTMFGATVTTFVPAAVVTVTVTGGADRSRTSSTYAFTAALWSFPCSKYANKSNASPN